MSPERASRSYQSIRRREQAEATRAAILSAARSLFADKGYAATTLVAVAREASVATPTVTAVFGTKARLLEALINEVLGLDAASSPALARPWWRQMVQEPNSRQQLQTLVANGLRVHERGADVYAIVRGAATADPDFAAVMERRQNQLWTDMRSLADLLAERGALAPGITPTRAADLMWALCGPEAYRLFVVARGWDVDEYGRWLVSVLTHSILAS